MHLEKMLEDYAEAHGFNRGSSPNRVSWNIWRTLRKQPGDQQELGGILLRAIRKPPVGQIVNLALYEEVVLLARTVLTGDLSG